MARKSRRVSVFVCALAMVAMPFMVLTPSDVRANDNGGWSHPSVISIPSIQDSHDPTVAVDSAGTAMAVWIAADPHGLNRIYYSLHEQGKEWQTPDAIPDVNVVTSQIELHLVSPLVGEFYAYYTMNVGQGVHVYASRYIPMYGWTGYAQQEDKPGAVPEGLDVATDGAGRIVLTWVEWNGEWDASQVAHAYAKLYNAGTLDTWRNKGGVTLLESLDSPVDPSAGTAVAIGSGNIATAVWDQPENYGGICSVRSARYENSIWSSAEIVSNGVEMSLYPDVAMNDHNDAVVVWMQNVGGTFSIFARKYIPPAGWGDTAAAIEPFANPVGPPKIAMNGAGSAIATYVCHKTGTYDVLYSNIYDPSLATGFDSTRAYAVSFDNAAFYGDISSHYDDIIMDDSGNAIAVWNQFDYYRYQALANNFNGATKSWSNLRWLESSNAGGPGVGYLMDADMCGQTGNAVAVWMIPDPYDYHFYDIMAATYEGAPALSVSAPTSGATTGVPVVEVSGTVEVGASVSVNGFEIRPSWTGAFSVKVPLLVGLNAITVTATSSTGTTTTVTRSVTFNNPIPQMTADISHLMSDMGVAQTGILYLRSDVNQLMSDMDVAYDDVAVLQSGVASLSTDMDAAQVDLQVLKGNVSALESSDDIAEAYLAALESLVTTIQGNITDLEGRIATLQATNVSALESSVESLETQVATLQSRIAGLDSEMTAAQTDIDSGEGDVTALEAALASSEAQVSALEGLLKESWSQLNSTKGELATAKTSLATAQADLVQTKADLESAKTDLENAKASISSTQSDVDKLPSQMFVLIGLVVVAIVLAALLALMYVSLKRAIGRIGK